MNRFAVVPDAGGPDDGAWDGTGTRHGQIIHKIRGPGPESSSTGFYRSERLRTSFCCFLVIAKIFCLSSGEALQPGVKRRCSGEMLKA